ncbi:MAG TPA: hypothetical protein VF868_01385 [Bacteroidia bacterium]|jgi:Tfp pilus assembly protein PilE
MKKLPAFTLLELTIGMMISSVIIGACYSGYIIVYKQFNSYRSVKQHMSEAVQFRNNLQNEFFMSANVSFKDHTLVFHLKDSDMLQYEFLDTLVLRKTASVVDTFNIATASIKSGFVFNNDSIPMEFINFISFDAVILKETQHLSFAKEYSAESLINKSISLKNQ